MAQMSEDKAAAVAKLKLSEFDTGSSEVQIALLTKRIVHLTEHFKIHKQDYHGRRGLVNMVSRRRKLLNYLKRTKPAKYDTVIAELGIRK